MIEYVGTAMAAVALSFGRTVIDARYVMFSTGITPKKDLFTQNVGARETWVAMHGPRNLHGRTSALWTDERGGDKYALLEHNIWKEVSPKIRKISLPLSQLIEASLRLPWIRVKCRLSQHMEIKHRSVTCTTTNCLGFHMYIHHAHEGRVDLLPMRRGTHRNPSCCLLMQG
jgi:hypothetical protein